MSRRERREKERGGWKCDFVTELSGTPGGKGVCFPVTQPQRDLAAQAGAVTIAPMALARKEKLRSSSSFSCSEAPPPPRIQGDTGWSNTIFLKALVKKAISKFKKLSKNLFVLLREVYGPPYSNFSHAQQPLKTRHRYTRPHDAAASNKNFKIKSRLNAAITNKKLAKPQPHTVEYQDTSCSTETRAAVGGDIPRRQIWGPPLQRRRERQLLCAICTATTQSNCAI